MSSYFLISTYQFVSTMTRSIASIKTSGYLNILSGVIDILLGKLLFFFFFSNFNVVGGANQCLYFKEKLKVPVFENERFSGHLIFCKKFWGGGAKKFFYLNEHALCFFGKKHCPDPKVKVFAQLGFGEICGSIDREGIAWSLNILSSVIDILLGKLLFFPNFNAVWGGGGGVNQCLYFKAKLKVPVFENERFSGHLIFFRPKAGSYPGDQKKKVNLVRLSVQVCLCIKWQVPPLFSLRKLSKTWKALFSCFVSKKIFFDLKPTRINWDNVERCRTTYVGWCFRSPSLTNSELAKCVFTAKKLKKIITNFFPKSLYIHWIIGYVCTNRKH